jgi:hypothetical protein
MPTAEARIEMSRRTQLWASGGGVQSAAIAALIVQGKLRPDLALIVDTEREQSTTWAYMDEVTAPALASVGVTLHRVRRSDYEKLDLYSGNGTMLMPVFTTRSGEVGKLTNYCSSYWKREIIKRWGNAQGVKAADTWLGFSLDEHRRATIRPEGKWRSRYPLIELAMNRGDCQALVAKMGWPEPPRSSCYMCPNHTQSEWRDIRDNKPEDWQRAIHFERDMHKRDPDAFLHPDAVPLDEVDLDERNGSIFGHCESGMCFT